MRRPSQRIVPGRGLSLDGGGGRRGKLLDFVQAGDADVAQVFINSRKSLV